VWEPSAATLALYETARRLARELGFDITYAAPAAAQAPISQARWESQHSVASGCAAPTAIRSTNISRSTAWSSAAGDGWVADGSQLNRGDRGMKAIRVDVGGFLCETDTLAPTKAGYDDFERGSGWPAMPRGSGALAATLGATVTMSGSSRRRRREAGNSHRRCGARRIPARKCANKLTSASSPKSPPPP
jgi:hypothetical protein